MMKLMILLVITGCCCLKLVNATTTEIKANVAQSFQNPGVNATDILRARGYRAKLYQFVTDDGYILSITRGINPLIKTPKGSLSNKRPILFVHGFSTDATSFLANSFGAQAKDLSHLNLANMSLEEARDLLADDETSHSLPMLALNLGHEVWLLHRRGTHLSRHLKADLDWAEPPTPYEKLLEAREFVEQVRRQKGHQSLSASDELENYRHQLNEEDKKKLTGGKFTHIQKITIDIEEPNLLEKIETRLKDKKRYSKLGPALAAASSALFDHSKLFDEIQLSLDKRFWNYSMDQQASYDIPNAIDVVRQITEHDKIVMIGDSSGGGIVLMTLVLNPGLSQKLAKVVAWAPAFVLGHSDSAAGYAWIIPVLQSYSGPFPLPFLSQPMEAAMQVFCSLEFMQRTICQVLENMGRGWSKGQTPIRPEYYSNIAVSVSSKEAAHVLQLAKNGSPQMYDFGSAEKNHLAYQQTQAPVYEPGLITYDKLSIWASSTDSLVSPADINLLTRSMKGELIFLRLTIE